MPIYSDLILNDERFIKLEPFSYDFYLDEFSFSNSYKEIDEDLKVFFNPHFSSFNELKTKLMNKIFSLKENPGVFDFEISYYSKDYGLRYYRIVGSNVDTINNVNGVIYDITNEHDLLEKVNHAERLRTVGELSSGIAHDFNNNLMVISGASELLMLGDLNEKQKEYVNKIFNAAKRSATLSKKLLMFSKESDLEEYFNLYDVINNVISIINYTSKIHININFKYSVVSAYIYGNLSAVTNAIINLVKNAIEASKEDGFIDIILSEEYLSSIPDNSIINIKPDGIYYKLEVIDYGHGISKENVRKIFNPFFSTKKETDGTGLGLSAVLSTVIASKGIICLDTKEGFGSKFMIYFPKK